MPRCLEESNEQVTVFLSELIFLLLVKSKQLFVATLLQFPKPTFHEDHDLVNFGSKCYQCFLFEILRKTLK